MPRNQGLLQYVRQVAIVAAANQRRFTPRSYQAAEGAVEGETDLAELC